MYVIKRTDGVYVAPSGSRSSYTHFLQKARTFPTAEAAQRECCPGNEMVVTVDSELRG